LDVGRDPLEDRRTEPGPIGLAMKLVPGGLAYAGADFARLRDGSRGRALDLFSRHLAGGGLLHGRLDAPEGPLEPCEGLAQNADLLVQARDREPEPFRRPEVQDLDRARTVDPVKPADPQLHESRVPGRVEEDEASAELEVAPLAAALGGDQERGTGGEAELGDLDVRARRGQVLVKDPDTLARLPLDRLPQPLQRLYVRDEDKGL